MPGFAFAKTFKNICCTFILIQMYHIRSEKTKIRPQNVFSVITLIGIPSRYNSVSLCQGKLIYRAHLKVTLANAVQCIKADTQDEEKKIKTKKK